MGPQRPGDRVQRGGRFVRFKPSSRNSCRLADGTRTNRHEYSAIFIVNANAAFLEQPDRRRSGKHRLDSHNKTARGQKCLRKNTRLAMAALPEKLDDLLLNRMDVDHAVSNDSCQIIFGHT